MTADGFDIIGDVHGCADKLERLLHTLGYREVNGAWKHPARQAVFVGDFIDRGPDQLRSVAIPKAMVEAGNAHAVVGNHEFNAVAMATRDDSGNWNRAHSARNLDQTSDFRDAVRFGSPTHTEILDWFMSLPLWLDLDGVRVVHACWHRPSMQIIEPLLSDAGSLTPALMIAANTYGSAAYDAAEVLLKGPEVLLDGWTWKDREDHSRNNGRVTWWDPQATTLRNGIRLAGDSTIFNESGERKEQLPLSPLPDRVLGITPTDPMRSPVCFGHYWFDAGPNNETLEVINAKAACVDFSAVNGGPLVAYRWSGETELTSENMVAAR